jgi:hypothetical protein
MELQGSGCVERSFRKKKNLLPQLSEHLNSVKVHAEHDFQKKLFPLYKNLQRLRAVKLQDTTDTSCTELMEGESSKRVKQSSSRRSPEDFVSKILRNVERNLLYIVENSK